MAVLLENNHTVVNSLKNGSSRYICQYFSFVFSVFPLNTHVYSAKNLFKKIFHHGASNAVNNNNNNKRELNPEELFDRAEFSTISKGLGSVVLVFFFYTYCKLTERSPL
jgi:cytochrome oxidase Cu insertion factor (SCO1/SenC/PrrC family)